MKKRLPLFAIFLFAISSLFSQVAVQSSAGRTAEDLVRSILMGNGVVVSNVTFNNSSSALDATSGAQLGTFTNNLTGFPGLQFADGLIITTGDISVAVGPNDEDGASSSVYNSMYCSELENLAGNTIYNPAVLEFDFMTTADHVTFNYVFASEEYPEYVDAGYNDIFGFFVTDLTTNQTSNVALIPGTNWPVSIDNVNVYDYSQYYHEVSYYSSYMEYDAYVGPFAATFAVVPCRFYHIKLAISNVGDDVYDSAVFLQGQSFSADATETNVIYDNEDLPVVVQDCNTATVTFNQGSAQNHDVVIPLTYSGTAVNGGDVDMLPASVTIPAGQTSVSLVIRAIGNYTPDTLTLNIYYEGTVCAEGTTITILVCKNEGIELASENVVVCQAADSISVELVSGHYGEIQWTPSAMLSNPNSLTTGFLTAPTEPTYFTVVASDRFHCTTDSTRFLYSFGEPIADTVRATICYGTTYNHYGFNLTQEGTYTRESQTAFGCDSSITVILTVPHPEVDIEIGTSDLCEDGFVDLTATMSGESIRWSNGEKTEEITVTKPGTYVATVVDGPCTAQDAVTIIPCPEADVYIPTAITPSDENGVNDVFYIPFERTDDIEEFSIQIYNRWGMLVFQSTNPNFTWDGTAQGKLMVDETYVYTIFYKTFNHPARTFKGAVTVL